MGNVARSATGRREAITSCGIQYAQRTVFSIRGGAEFLATLHADAGGDEMRPFDSRRIVPTALSALLLTLFLASEAPASPTWGAFGRLCVQANSFEICPDVDGGFGRDIADATSTDADSFD